MYLYTNSLLLMFSYCTPELEEFLFFFSANYKQKKYLGRYLGQNKFMF